MVLLQRSIAQFRLTGWIDPDLPNSDGMGSIGQTFDATIMSETTSTMSTPPQIVPVGETFLDKAKRKTVEEPLVPLGQ